jgi:hypothetical protein
MGKERVRGCWGEGRGRCLPVSMTTVKGRGGDPIAIVV